MGNNRRRFVRLDDQNKKLWASVEGWVGVSPTPPVIANMDITPPQQGVSEHEYSTVRVIDRGRNTRKWLHHCIGYGKDDYPGREDALASYLNKVGFVGLFFFLYIYLTYDISDCSFPNTGTTISW